MKLRSQAPSRVSLWATGFSAAASLAPTRHATGMVRWWMVKVQGGEVDGEVIGDFDSLIVLAGGFGDHFGHALIFFPILTNHND